MLQGATPTMVAPSNCPVCAGEVESEDSADRQSGGGAGGPFLFPPVVDSWAVENPSPVAAVEPKPDGEVFIVEEELNPDVVAPGWAEPYPKDVLPIPCMPGPKAEGLPPGWRIDDAVWFWESRIIPLADA